MGPDTSVSTAPLLAGSSLSTQKEVRWRQQSWERIGDSCLQALWQPSPVSSYVVSPSLEVWRPWISQIIWHHLQQRVPGTRFPQNLPETFLGRTVNTCFPSFKSTWSTDFKWSSFDCCDQNVVKEAHFFLFLFLIRKHPCWPHWISTCWSAQLVKQ